MINTKKIIWKKKQKSIKTEKWKVTKAVKKFISV